MDKLTGKKKQQYFWGFGVDTSTLKTLRLGPCVDEKSFWDSAKGLEEVRFYVLDTADINKARGQLRAKDKAAGYSWSEVLDKKDNSRINSGDSKNGRIFSDMDN